MRSRSLLLVLLLATGVALGADPPGSKDKDPKKKEAPDLGMSILGNQEAPKALVIVPWESSAPGDSLGIATMLDDSRLPIDKEVFMRALIYYHIRSESMRHGGALPASAAQGRN